MSGERPRFRGGDNIALKVPAFRFEETVRFYRDIIGLPVRESGETSQAFQFGPVTLWVDRVEEESQTDVWLELFTEDADGAAGWLAERGTPVRDELEPLAGVKGHWISDPAGVVHLLYENRTGGEKDEAGD